MMTQPVLHGLVLAGGQSTRMGRDKGLLDYHGQPQRVYAAGLVRSCCSEVFISCNVQQSAGLDQPKLIDLHPGGGPLSGILSAFALRPDVAWLVLACDLPRMDGGTLAYLVAHREPRRIATAFADPEGRPEPLVSIWEPSAYPFLLRSFAAGQLSPRKFLEQHQAKLLEMPDAGAFLNVNDPEGYNRVKGESC